MVGMGIDAIKDAHHKQRLIDFNLNVSKGLSIIQDKSETMTSPTKKSSSSVESFNFTMEELTTDAKEAKHNH